MGEFRTLAGNDVSVTVYEQEPTVYLGDIYGDNEVSVRLQSLLRESQYTINALRDKLIEVGKASSNIKYEDQSRTIEFLRIELAKTSEELSRLRNNVSVNAPQVTTTVSATGDVRALQARNQELESQLRTSKLSYENTIRDLKTQIERYESQIRTLEVRLQEKSVIAGSSTTFGSPQVDNNTPRGTNSSFGQFTPSSTSSQNTGNFNATYNSNRPSGTTASGVVGTSNLTNSGSYNRPTGTSGVTASNTYGTSSYSSSGSGVTTSQVTGTGAYGSATYATGLSGSRTGVATGATGLSGSRTATGVTGATGTTYTSGSNLSGSGSFRTGATGTVGFTSGTTGLAGSRTGATGATGATYTSGATGATGSSGSYSSSSYSATTFGQGANRK